MHRARGDERLARLFGRWQSTQGRERTAWCGSRHRNHPIADAMRGRRKPDKRPCIRSVHPDDAGRRISAKADAESLRSSGVALIFVAKTEMRGSLHGSQEACCFPWSSSAGHDAHVLSVARAIEEAGAELSTRIQ